MKLHDNDGNMFDANELKGEISFLLANRYWNLLMNTTMQCKT